MRRHRLGLLAASLAGCATSTPGVVRTAAGDPLVTIGAGYAQIGGGERWRVWYMIDTRTQTCWMRLGEAGAAMDCCDLRRVPEATPYITWRNDAVCGSAAPGTPSVGLVSEPPVPR